MIKEIQYAGYSTEPSDYECSDGQLATSLNLINEDNQLKPLFQPHIKVELPANCEVVFIHKTSNYEHYIIHNKSTLTLYWIDSDAVSITLSSSNQIGSYADIAHINAVGNTLLVFTATAINYLLWKSNSYNVLGTKLPEIAISFGLIGHPRLYSLVTEDGSSSQRGTFTIEFNSIYYNELNNTFSDENKTKITSQVMAKVNKFIAEQTTNKGRFCFPFFVRWAYRLYDGSHMMHSAPVLMTPSTTPAPIVIWKRVTGGGIATYTEAELDIMMVAADLDYSLTRHGNYNDLEDWQDIISGIDIYISKPIYTYDQNGEFTSFHDEDNLECKFIGRLYNGEKDSNTPDTTLANSVTEDRMLAPFSSTSFMDKYMEYSYSHIYSMYFATNRKVPNATLHMPEFSEDKRNENIESNATFYKLATIGINELEVATRKIVDINDDYLQSLVNREVMTDDYLTHDRLIASSSYCFNQRLNLSGVKRELFDGFISNAMFPFCQTVHSFNINTSDNKITITTALNYAELKMLIFIRENGEIYCVENSPNILYLPYLREFVDTNNWTDVKYISDGTKKVTTYNFDDGTKTVTRYNGNTVISTQTFNNRFKPTSWGSWLFYPNNNAFKIAIYQNLQLVFVCDLKAHDFLNGAYAFLGFNSERGNSSTSLPEVTVTPDDDIYGGIVEVPNKIYTSEVNNPFFFPLLGINNVGSGKILGMSSANKALSQGQFGQFPLYAFTTEGVWALEVSTTGTYSARQPITRDVCINPNSIIQLDSAVLFATDRGIMLIEGSQTKCITDSIFTEQPFNVLNLPGIDQLHTKLGHSADACLPTKPFRGFLAGCQMVYDYVHQRIIVFNPTTQTVNGTTKPLYTYAYVFSLKSKMWGMIYSNLQSTINSYPDALAMTHDNELVSFSDTDETVSKGLYVTRPIKLESANIHKTISTLIQRGHFQRGDVGTVLYGSRDLYTWYLVWSSQDNYLRGFRGTPYKYFRIAGLASLAEGKSIFGASVNFEPRHTNQLR